jgi:hypothetical protein
MGGKQMLFYEIGSGEFLFTLRASEMLGFLVLMENNFVVEYFIAIIAKWL